MENQYKILLLDNDYDSCLRTKVFLNNIGFHNIKYDFERGFEKNNSTFSMSDCDICLMDYCFGKNNGFISGELNSPRMMDVPIILLTENEEFIDKYKEIEAFDMDYLVKSQISPWILSRAIKCTLARKKAVKELSEKNQEINNLILNMDSIIAQKTKSLETAKDDLKKLLDKEIKLSEMKSKFVSMASHEFRTPLSSILSSASLIEKYADSIQQEKRKRHISRIKSSVQNLSFILNDFLSLDKIESGNLRQEPVLVDFEEFVNQILDEMSAFMHKNQFIRFHHEGNNFIIFDPNLMKNVLINLLSNAIKYSPEGQDIFLESNSEPNLLQIKVKDYGIGIPDNDKKRMFECFFRASNAYLIQGTVLGLTIVKRYLDLMGGKISFQSEIGKGTTFEISLTVPESQPASSH